MVTSCSRYDLKKKWIIGKDNIFWYCIWIGERVWMDYNKNISNLPPWISIRMLFGPFRHALERSLQCSRKDKVKCVSSVCNFYMFRPAQQNSTLIKKHCRAMQRKSWVCTFLFLLNRITFKEIADVSQVLWISDTSHLMMLLLFRCVILLSNMLDGSL